MLLSLFWRRLRNGLFVLQALLRATPVHTGCFASPGAWGRASRVLRWLKAEKHGLGWPLGSFHTRFSQDPCAWGLYDFQGTRGLRKVSWSVPSVAVTTGLWLLHSQCLGSVGETDESGAQNSVCPISLCPTWNIPSRERPPRTLEQRSHYWYNTRAGLA